MQMLRVIADALIDDDITTTSPDDFLDVLPALRTDVGEPNGPDSRAGRAHSALRRTHPVGSADKMPFGISHVDLCFQESTHHRNSGT